MRQSVDELSIGLAERVIAAEAMADSLTALSREAGAMGGGIFSAALIDMARLHRVAAIVSRAKLAALATCEGDPDTFHLDASERSAGRRAI